MYFSDPLFQFQSYLSGIAEIGSQDLDDRSPVLRIEAVWDDYRGEGVIVAVPGPIDRLHPDLVANYDTSTLGTYDPLDDLASNPEASALSTFWAGLVAADDNGEGLVGVAPDSSVVSTIVGDYDIIVVPAALDRTTDTLASYVDDAVGRDGLGEIIIANNPLGDTFYNVLDDDAASGELNTDFLLHNQRHVISVGALSAYGKKIAFPVAGDMTLVSTPVFTDSSSTNFFEDISPTIGLDPRGNLGISQVGETLGFWELLAETQTGVDIESENYWIDSTGIGANAITAGIVALMLEANPDLGWRDVQEILAYSATFTDRQEGDVNSAGFPWEINNASNWNGGGLHFNAAFGFGAIDVFGAVRLAETWTETSTSANETVVVTTPDAPLPTGPVDIEDGESVTFTFTPDTDVLIEHVTLTVDFSAPLGTFEYDVDMFTILIIAPDGTVSEVAAPATVFDSLDVTNIAQDYSSRRFWGETAQQGDGEWEVVFLYDGYSSSAETEFFDVSLSFFGDANVDDNTYIYTDEFDDLAGLGYSNEIDDGTGTNAINASAVSEDLILRAEAGTRSQAGGETLYRLSDNTKIATLIAGDGDDRLTGTNSANTLIGGRGDDFLEGRSGADNLEGGTGADRLLGSGGVDTLLGEGGADRLIGGSGNDLLVGGAGDDNISGSNGDDILRGGAGNDILRGGNGDDTLEGGKGDDRLLGGSDADTFLFTGSIDNDKIVNFDASEDTLLLSQNLWQGNLTAQQVVNRYATVVGDDVILDFGNGETIRLLGVDSTNGLAGSIDFL